MIDPLIISLGEIEGIKGLIGKLLLRKLLNVYRMFTEWLEAGLKIVLLTKGPIELKDRLVRDLQTA